MVSHEELGERVLRRQVEDVLYYVWDPLELSSLPRSEGEYEWYVSKVFALLLCDEGPETISEYLQAMMKDYMERVPDEAGCDKVAALLHEHGKDRQMASREELEDRELRRRIGEVLHYVWDPIGVSTVACARGEYDAYASEVFVLLFREEGAETISKYLQGVEKDRMGLPPDKKRCDEVAELLLAHREAIKEGSGRP